MYNKGTIIPGLAIFVLIVTSPLWLNAFMTGSTVPKVELPPGGETKCVASATEMRASHMQLLNEWRDSVVRKGVRTYTSDADHHQYDMSLQNTCMKCHRNKAAFCDRCHNYVGVSPSCWNCHVEPKGGLFDGTQ